MNEEVVQEQQFEINQEYLPKVITAVIVTSGMGILLGFLGGSLMINGIITGTLLMTGLSMIAYHTRQKWPALLPFVVAHKEVIDTTIYIVTFFAFMGMGITAGISMSIFAILTSIGFMALKAAGIDENYKSNISLWESIKITYSNFNSRIINLFKKEQSIVA